ncbi:MAG: hypothetical protein AB7G80_01790 [Dongiaceae bacterium]
MSRWWERYRFDLLPWLALPALLCFALSLLGSLPIFALSFSLPFLPLGAMMYWLIFFPQSMPAWLVFLFGLWCDALQGAPLGFFPAIFLIFYFTTMLHRKFFWRLPFWALWILAALFWAAVMVAEALLLLPKTGQPVSLVSIVVPYALTVCCFPLIYGIAAGVHRLIPRN